jgi:phosphatidylserine/phosphatidylglycerophosphate/cardiolipin synthase-like enzyme
MVLLYQPESYAAEVAAAPPTAPAAVLDRFVLNSPTVPAQHRATIERLAQEIVASLSTPSPVRSVTLVGHTDVSGPTSFNLDLGRRRASEVQRLLVAAIERRRPGAAARLSIELRSAAATQPAAPGDSPQARALNRRVELFLVRETPPPPPPPVRLRPPRRGPSRWRRAVGAGFVRDGNSVQGLIDGPETFRSMVQAIRTATGRGDYIYLLGWWLSDNFPMIAGDPTTTARSLFSAASARGVQIRAMLWDQWGKQNTAEVGRINALANGGAILDNDTLAFGSHHQKILIVKGSRGLIAFCGGVDINPDRVVSTAGGGSSSSGGLGTPMHDVHCRIMGPAAKDLVDVFLTRWTAHPAHSGIDRAKGAPLGAREPVPPRMGNLSVRVATTFNRIRPHKCAQSRSVRRTIIGAMREARRFIYMEDQYLVNMEMARELRAALPRIQHLTILIPHSSISDMPQVWMRRKAFIDHLRSGPDAHKVRVFFLVTPSTGKFGPHTYVHAKSYFIDDEIAIIGSANCNRRGFSYDSEAIAAIFEETQPESGAPTFAQRVRMRLWSEHLGVPASAVADGVASAGLWLAPRPTSRARPYNPNAGKDPLSKRMISWDRIIDPSADGLPACTVATGAGRVVTAAREAAFAPA